MSPGRWLSEWGCVTRDTEEEHGIESNPQSKRRPILNATNRRPSHPGPLRAIEQTMQDYPGKAVIVHANDVFSLPRYWMGMENLLMAIAADPSWWRRWWTCR